MCSYCTKIITTMFEEIINCNSNRTFSASQSYMRFKNKHTILFYFFLCIFRIVLFIQQKKKTLNKEQAKKHLDELLEERRKKGIAVVFRQNKLL